MKITHKRGSEWRKWDLQVGTKHYTNYNGITLDNVKTDHLTRLTGLASAQINSDHAGLTDEEYAKLFVEYFVHYSEIDVIAIANHNTGLGIQEILDYLESKRDYNDPDNLYNKKVVFPGVEIGAADRCHIILVFNPMNNDHKMFEYEVDGKTVKRKLKWHEYINDFLKIIGIPEPRTSNGKPHNSKTLATFQILSLSEEWSFIPVFPHVENSDGLWRELQESNKKEVYKHSCFGIVDIKENSKNQDLLAILRGKHSQWGNKEVAIIATSDASSLVEIGNRYTFIKADPTFSGLRQIIYEPIQRVKIDVSLPDQKDPNLIIDQVCFKSSDNTFTNQPIFLNKNLNVIIGGKSSGKSLLLSCIAAALSKDVDIMEKYIFLKDVKDFDFEIKLSSGISDNLKTHLKERKPSVIPEIKYIPQNKLSELAGHEKYKKSGELNEIVRKLLREDITTNQHYENFLQEIKQHDREREAIINDYFDILDKKKILEEAIFKLGQKDVLVKGIGDKRKKITELAEKSGLTEDQINLYRKYKKELEDIQNDKKKIADDWQVLNNFVYIIVANLSQIGENKSKLLNTIKSDLTDKFKLLFGSLDISLEQAKKHKEYIDSEEGVKFIQNIIEKITLTEKELLTKIEPFIQKEQYKKEIEELENGVKEELEKFASIELNERKLKEMHESLENKKHELFENFEATHGEYTQLIENFRSRTIELESEGLNIVGKTYFNYLEFGKMIYPHIDGRIRKNYDYNKYFILNSELSSMSEIDSDKEKIITSLKNLFEDVISNNYSLNGSSSPKKFLQDIFSDFFYDYWEVEYAGDKLGGMSTGKASFVILMLIVGLSKSKSPILIDQPEDNLDNRSISKELVKYLKEKKVGRQIILVTHNPNVVVNADAENVIVANQKGQNDRNTSSQYQFDYVNGALENTKPLDDKETDLLKSMGIREHVADIVEGGEEAFMKRERKYDFKRNKNTLS